MNTTLSISVLLAAVVLGTRPGQESLVPVERSLARGGGAQVAQQVFDAGGWAEALRGEDLGKRLEAYRSVLGEAGRDPAVRETVEGWARDTGRLELAWTAQLMLRELDAGGTRGRGQRQGLRGGLFGGDPFGGDSLGWGFPDDVFRQMDGLFGGGLFHGMQLPQGGVSQSEGFSMQIGPDGVRVERRETVDGEEQVQTYEADSLEALLDAHPELESEIRSHGGLSFRLGSRGGGGGQGFWQAPRGLVSEGPRTDRLGVQVLDSRGFTREVQGIDGGVGLEVVRVLIGSLGEALGLEVGDVVVAVNGEVIRGVEDVKRVLAERKSGGEVRVEVVDLEGEKQVRVWVPEGELGDVKGGAGPKKLRKVGT